MKVTAAEKKMVETYRDATAELKKIALKVLKGEYSETALTILDTVGGGTPDIGGDFLGGKLGDFLGGLLGGKK